MFKIAKLTRHFKKDNRGAMAVEFAFVFPVMLSAYMFLADVNLAISDNRRVAEMANSTAQVAATFPIYDTSARVSIYRSLDAHAAFLRGRQLDATLTSIAVQNGEFEHLFTRGLMPPNRGVSLDPPAGWMQEVESGQYVDGDSIILVRAQIESASYLLNMFPNGTLFTEWAQTQPYNSRTYGFRFFSSDRDRYNWQ